MISKTTLEFWFDLASTYSYLSALRIEGVAAEAGISVDWKPFLLGPVFQAQGWTTSPFNLYPAKGRYMVRDIQRIGAARGLPFRLPDPFPQNSLLAARVALLGLEEGWGAAFVKAAYRHQFGEGGSIAGQTDLAPVIAMLRLDPAGVASRAGGQEIKHKLRSNTETAMAHGVFGAPTFRTADGELFWGDDRLDQAVAWAQQL